MKPKDQSKTEMTELRGFEFTSHSLNRRCDCFVAHIDREVGITIKNYETQQSMFCLNKERVLAQAKQNGCSYGNRLYHEAFNLMLKGIISGSGRVGIVIDWTTKEVYLQEYVIKFAKPFTCPWS